MNHRTMQWLGFLRNDSWRDAVYPHREVRLAFGGIDLRVGRRIHDDIGTLVSNDATNRVRIGEVQRGAISSDNFAELPQGAAQLPTDLAGGAGQQDPNRRSPYNEAIDPDLSARAEDSRRPGSRVEGSD